MLTNCSISCKIIIAQRKFIPMKFFSGIARRSFTYVHDAPGGSRSTYQYTIPKNSQHTFRHHLRCAMGLVIKCGVIQSIYTENNSDDDVLMRFFCEFQFEYGTKELAKRNVDGNTTFLWNSVLLQSFAIYSMLLFHEILYFYFSKQENMKKKMFWATAPIIKFEKWNMIQFLFSFR